MHKQDLTHDCTSNDYLLSNDVALRLRCSAQAVRAYARAGKLRYITTVRGVRLFREADVLAFEARRAQAKE